MPPLPKGLQVRLPGSRAARGSLVWRGAAWQSWVRRRAHCCEPLGHIRRFHVDKGKIWSETPVNTGHRCLSVYLAGAVDRMTRDHNISQVLIGHPHGSYPRTRA